MLKVKFEGIDDWNRPVFRHIGKDDRFCALDKLFPYEAPESEVLEQVDESDLVYKGSKFQSEPMGTSCNVEIIRTV